MYCSCSCSWKCYKPRTFLLTCDKVHNPLRLPRKNDIWTSKSGPNPSVLHCWLGNVLRATTTCTFSTSQLPKVVREWCALYILTWKCASRHRGVHFFDISTSKSGPNSYVYYTFDLEMCFAPQRYATFHFSSGQMAPHPPLKRGYFSTLWSHKSLENTVNRDFLTFSRTCIFFLLTFSPLWSSHFFSSPLWLFPALLFHLSMLSEVWLLNFLQSCSNISCT